MRGCHKNWLVFVTEKEVTTDRDQAAVLRLTTEVHSEKIGPLVVGTSGNGDKVFRVEATAGDE